MTCFSLCYFSVVPLQPINLSPAEEMFCLKRAWGYWQFAATLPKGCYFF